MIKKLSVAYAIALVIIIYATIEGWLTPIQGIILGVLTFLAPIIVTAIITTVVANELTPKPSLKIKNIKFVKKSFQNINGYQIKAEVTNKRKKICSKIDATFQIKDDKNNSPKLLHINVDKTNGNETVRSREENMRNIAYAWINKKGAITTGSLSKLRQKDLVELLFPYETTAHGKSSIGGASSLFSSETLLKIEPSKKYHVKITVKGDDSEENTISKSAKKTLSA